jgi:hypothetical protein
MVYRFPLVDIYGNQRVLWAVDEVDIGMGLLLEMALHVGELIAALRLALKAQRRAIISMQDKTGRVH